MTMTAPAPLIVVPYDFSPASKAALGRAVEFARTFGARLGLVHVVDESAYYVVPFDLPSVSPVYLRELEERLGGHLEGVAGPVREAGLACETAVLRGLIAPTILAHVEEVKPWMVVMGTHGLTGWRHALLGSVAERVVQRARCPVLVVPDPERE
jgi:nucleotide-binding universal stress UspA family protein